MEAKVIQDQEIGVQHLAQQAWLCTTGPSRVQVLQQVMGGSGQDAILTFESFDAQGVGQVTLSDTRWAAQQDVLVA